MRVGVTILPEYRWPEARARWRAAEELGFDDAWTFDHLGFGELLDTPWYGALPTLAAAAAVTSRIRLGTLVSNPNFRHPAPFARDLIGLEEVASPAGWDREAPAMTRASSGLANGSSTVESGSPSSSNYSTCSCARTT